MDEHGTDADLLAQIALVGRVYGTLFSTYPDQPAAAEIIKSLGGPDPPRELDFEYQRLFVGPTHLSAPPWGSVYLDKDNVLFGISTLELRTWLKAHDITVATELREPEDQIGKMLLLMAWLAEETPVLIPEFLSEHLMPWAPRYLELLEQAAELPFYRNLAHDLQESLAALMSELAINAVPKRLYL